jgi:Phage Tail Collar Domain
MELANSLIRAGRRVRRYRHVRTVAELTGAILLLSGGATAAAAVLPASAGTTTIRGCANEKTGALTVLLKASATCKKGTKALSWNKTGPKGPAGTTGIFGGKTNTATAGTGNGTCELGQVVLTAGRTTVPGTMPADGQVLAINQNTALFSLLGTEYGGNGTSTFALPSLKKAAPNGLSYSICVDGLFP